MGALMQVALAASMRRVGGASESPARAISAVLSPNPPIVFPPFGRVSHWDALRE